MKHLEEVALLQQQLEKEKRARKAAEKLLDTKIQELADLRKGQHTQISGSPELSEATPPSENSRPEAPVTDKALEGQRMAQELKEKTDFIRLVLDTSPNYVFVRNNKGEIVLTNQAYAKLFTREVEELIGLRIADFHQNQEENAAREAADKKVLENRTEVETISPFTKPDGEIIWVSTLRRPLITADGEVHVYGISTDITQEVNAKQQLKESEALYRLLSENSRDIIALYKPDIDSEALFVSQAVREMLGYLPEELTGTSTFELVHPEDRSYVKENILQKVLQEKKSLTLQYRVLKKEGAEVWVETITKPIFDSKGKMVNVLSSSRDITERREAQETIKKNEKKFKDLVSFSQAAIFTHDLEGTLLSVNPSFCELMAYSEEEVLGKKVSLFYSRESKDVFSPYLQDLKDDQYAEGEVCALNRSEEKIHLFYTSYLVEEPNAAPYVVCNAQDITERVLAERAIKKAKEQAEKSVSMKESFLANTSHEIRTPLNGILGISSLLSRTKLDDKQRNFLAIIRKSANNLLVVINDILDFRKIDAGKLELEEIPFDMHEVIQTACQTLTFKTQEKELFLEVKPLPIAHTAVKGDPYRLNQVLLNLMNNAIKFTEKGGVTLSSQLIEETSSQVILEFSVTDTGIGIPEDTHEKIFKEFMQETAGTSRKYGGTGLGLNISKRLIEMQNGRIWVESEVGKGSSFKFVLPFLKCGEEEIAHLPLEKERTDLSSLKTAHVLLAEDNEINVVLAQTLLENRGIRVDVARNGKEALALLGEKPYDLVLMDIQMPEMDGIKATRLIRSLTDPQKANIPIIALTANALKGEAERYRKAGMNAYLSKPFKEEALFRKIARLLPKKELAAPAVEAAAGKMDAPLPAAWVRPLETMNTCNLTHLEEMGGGDRGFTIKMLTLFLKKAPLELGLLKEAVKSGNKPEIKFVAHRLKPMVSMVGAEELQVNLRQIEALAALEDEMPEIRKLLSKVSAQGETAIQELNAVLPFL